MCDNKPSGELQNLSQAAKPLISLFGTARIRDVRPTSLKVVRQQMIDDGLSRKTINNRVNRIRRIFKWGVENDLVEPAILQVLKAIEPLRYGRCGVKEGPGVKPVPDELTEKTLPCMNANIAAIEDRGIVIDFKPSAGEVHVRAKTWFDDPDVYSFIERHLGLITRQSMRYYVHGNCLRQAHPDRWQPMLLELMGVDPRIRALATLLNDARYRTQEERAAAFESMGLGDRSTYYRWKKRLEVAS